MKIISIRWILLRLTSGFLLLLQINRIKTDIPNCDYEDTVEMQLSDSKEFSNSSYIYEGLSIPAYLVGTYDYEILANGIHKTVPEHKRGCVCKIKQCVKFCCPRNERKVPDERKCSSELYEEIELNSSITINGNRANGITGDVFKKFVFQQGLPCHLTFETTEKERWTLTENGSIYSNVSGDLSRRDYCLTPQKKGGIYILSPLYCLHTSPLSTKLIVNVIAMLISVPFFFATIFVYLLIPKLRNLHGMCLSSYLLALAIGYILLVMNSTGMKYMEFTRKTCYAIGFSSYYFVMAAFFWLNVISFDLWRNFRSIFGRYERNQEKYKRFSFYSLYAWGFPVLLTIIIMVAQKCNIDDDLKPGIGEDIHNNISCWIQGNNWSAMIYLYGPGALIIISNIVLFILSFVRIYKVNKESEQMKLKDANCRHVGKQWNNFLLYLRLFIVMGVSWILEVVGYIIGTEKVNEAWFYASDVYNGLQGLIIFSMFVLKPNVLVLIKSRILCSDKRDSPNRIKMINLVQINNTESSN